MLALDDAVRAFKPDEVLISCLPESRFGLMRKDLIEWAKARFEVPVVHIPVRIEDDAVRWDITHTLVVATQTVNAPTWSSGCSSATRSARTATPSSARAPATRPARRSATASPRRSPASTATRSTPPGQPMSPEPFPAVENAIEHYRVDEVLISTFAGRSSKWLEDGLIEQVKEITDMPVEHVESAGGSVEPVGAGVGSCGRGELMESASVPVGTAPTRTSTTARPRPTPPRRSTARRSASCSSSSAR